MEAIKKRNTLPIKTKFKILKELEIGKKRNQIAKEYNIAVSTLCKIIKNSKYVEKQYFALKNVNKKRDRKPKYEELNKAMSKWFEQMIEEGTQVTGPILLEKAQQVAVKLDLLDFKANAGWLQRWKKNENIQFRKPYEESASVDTMIANSFKENVLYPLLDEYDLDDIYNADETCLFYKALPNKSYGYINQQSNGCKTPKDRLTLLFITNATGSDKYVYSIGKCKQPRLFRGKNLPIPYKFNNKALMSSALWSEIIKELSKELQKKKKKILLLIDNASCHNLEFTPDNIKILFLPLCTSSIIQPLDQGIVKCFKTHYRENLIREQILAIEGGYMEKFLRSITVLRSLYIIKRSWWLVTPQTIQNCFRKAGIVNDDITFDCELVEDMFDVEYCTFFKEIADIENDCISAVNDNDIINELQQHDSEEEDLEVESETICKPSREEAIKALFIIKMYMESDDHNVINIENTLYRQRNKSLVQRKIENYLQFKRN